MYHFLNTKNAHKTIHENINQAINDRVYSFIDKLKFSIYWKDTAGGSTQKKIDELLISFQEKTVEGTGFGLACSQITMEKMGGKLEAHFMRKIALSF